jgi:hypothetical protein
MLFGDLMIWVLCLCQKIRTQKFGSHALENDPPDSAASTPSNFTTNGTIHRRSTSIPNAPSLKIVLILS